MRITEAEWKSGKVISYGADHEESLGAEYEETYAEIQGGQI